MSKQTGGSGRTAPEMARGLSLAFEFTGAVILFWLIGRGVDGWLNTAPWAQIVGSVIGWGGGFAHVYYKAQRNEETKAGQR